VLTDHRRPPADLLHAESRHPEKAGILLGLSLILPLFLYVGLASRLVTARIGYEMDEALYVQSAVFMLAGTGAPPFVTSNTAWITLFGRRWPLMIISYVGASKAFVALPLFAIFGISAEVARFAGVLLGGLGIVGLVALIGSRISRAAGLIVGVALAVHPSYLDFTVFDNGGVSTWMGAMGLIALALTNHLRRRSTLSALLLGIAGGLGVWARVNVLWLIASAIAAALVVYGRRALPTRRQLTAIMVGGFCGALPMILYEWASRLGTLRFISTHRRSLTGHQIAKRLRALAELMISDGEQRAIWSGPPLSFWEMAIGAALLVFVLVTLFVRVPAGDPALSRARRAFAISAVALTLIMLMSGLGISQHHLIAVLPLALSALAILAVEVGRRFRRSIGLLAPVAAGLVVLWLAWDVRIDRGLRRTGGRFVWSSAINDVAVYLGSHPITPSRLKILDWGFQNSLYVLSGGSVHGSELFWNATGARSSRGTAWASEIRDGGSFLFFLFPVAPSHAAVQGFSRALKEYRGPRRERVFRDRTGSPVAVLLEIPGR
jgi:hypothetical protein